MKKPTLLYELMYGYQAGLTGKEYETLKEEIIQAAKQVKDDDVDLLAEKMIKEFPQFHILHQAFVRRRLDKIAFALSTIKVIVVIGFIFSIIAVIAFAAGISNL